MFCLYVLYISLLQTIIESVDISISFASEVTPKIYYILFDLFKAFTDVYQFCYLRSFPNNNKTTTLHTYAYTPITI